MDQRQGNRGYLSRKRRHAVSAIAVLAVIVFVLYAIPKVQRWFAGDDETGVATGTINSLIGSFQHFFDSSSPDFRPLTDSLLTRPLNLRYEMVGDKVFISKPFKVAGITVSKAVFSVEKEHSWVHSISFVSSDTTLFCQGNMQKGADKFTVFHCSRQKKRDFSL